MLFLWTTNVSQSLKWLRKFVFPFFTSIKMKAEIRPANWDSFNLLFKASWIKCTLHANIFFCKILKYIYLDDRKKWEWNKWQIIYPCEIKSVLQYQYLFNAMTNYMHSYSSPVESKMLFVTLYMMDDIFNTIPEM